jgi:hypothetical protein
MVDILERSRLLFSEMDPVFKTWVKLVLSRDSSALDGVPDTQGLIPALNPEAAADSIPCPEDFQAGIRVLEERFEHSKSWFAFCRRLEVEFWYSQNALGLLQARKQLGEDEHHLLCNEVISPVLEDQSTELVPLDRFDFQLNKFDFRATGLNSRDPVSKTTKPPVPCPALSISDLCIEVGFYEELDRSLVVFELLDTESCFD